MRASGQTLGQVLSQPARRGLQAVVVESGVHARRRCRHLPSLDAPVLRHVIGHQQVNDAYLLHLARHHGGRVATFDPRLTVHAHQGSEVVVIPAFAT